MGYLHDTAMSQAIHPNECMFSAGTWTHVETGVADIWGMQRAAANATFNVRVPIKLPSNSVALKGAKLVSIDIFWDVATEAMDALAATIYQTIFPATGADFAAATSHAFSYDSGHDGAAERNTADEHTMTLTLTTPVWIDNDDMWFVELGVDGGANGVFTFLGARINYTLRM